MTQPNYKERLDELILRWWNGDYDKSFDELSAVIKTEITQLFKDLVAEAKPEILTTKDGSDPWTRGVEGTKQGLLKLLEERDEQNN